MIDVYSVDVTTQAEAQMEELLHYITWELKSVDAALHLLSDLEDAISSLSQFPQRIALTEEEPWCSYGIRKMSVGNFLIYFWIDKEHHNVQITSVIYARRERVRQLTKMNLFSKHSF